MMVELITAQDDGTMKRIGLFTLDETGTVVVDDKKLRWMLEPIRFGTKRITVDEGDAFLKALPIAYAGSYTRAQIVAEPTS
jgi:hypothetical protein